jgi:hypothetical protein
MRNGDPAVPLGPRVVEFIQLYFYKIKLRHVARVLLGVSIGKELP